ncbi:hypothetical protein PG985_013005 [Apiospora marii]|uniref:Aspartyl/asparaginy/proline hydroxylase domain-containing protein n=1 Tax=Apiospora marii TaxID=335849 RepID=A0ABR1RC30_9PEZI
MSYKSHQQDTPSGIMPKSLGRRLVDMVLQRNKTPKSPPAERSASPAPEVKPEQYLTIQNLVTTLKAVDFWIENRGDVRGRQLEGMMRSWEESDKRFPIGCLEGAWYALQPREVGCRPRFMIRNDRETYPRVWHRPSIIRVQRCFYGNKEHHDADGITCYQLGTIWTSNRPTTWELLPPDPSGRKRLSYWRRTPFKLVVEMKRSEEGGEEITTGSPTGAVWVVNDSGYHRAHADKNAKTELEGVLMARVADSLGDLVGCGRRERWPKFEKADADYLDYFPCYQKEKGGPIFWKGTRDDECY